VHALRVVEHDHDIEVGGRDQPRAAPVLRLGEGEEGERDRGHEQPGLQRAPPAGAARHEPEYERLVAEAADGSNQKHGADHEQRRHDHGEAGTEQPQRLGEPHGNLR
jgi:hypothetical protein